MARLPPQAPDPTPINLTRLLSRLEQILLTDAAQSRAVRASSFERAKIATNLEYARSLLLRLERESLAIKTLSRKQSTQGDLLEKKELVKRLNERLHELNQLNDLDSEEEDGEDLLGEDTPSESNQNTEDETPNEFLEDLDLFIPTSLDRRRPSSPLGTPDSRDSHEEQSHSIPGSTQHLISAVRVWRPTLNPTETTGYTTSSERHSAIMPTDSTESFLRNNRTEQEALTASLLSMASALKESSQQFAVSLENEKAVLSRAGEGLDKSAQGMEAARRRMGMLRRMTEGRGWWGRMMMYASIAGLIVVALVLVGFLPKLRF